MRCGNAAEKNVELRANACSTIPPISRATGSSSGSWALSLALAD